MHRLSRPLHLALKSTPQVTRRPISSSIPLQSLPELTKTYETTLSLLKSIPETSVYRQGVEALTQQRLRVVVSAEGNTEKVETELKLGKIEDVLDIAKDELSVVGKMVEWKS
jgi:NADH dehydrogenase (ubiquinone) 1 alpha subcomplex subunit 5